MMAETCQHCDETDDIFNGSSYVVDKQTDTNPQISTKMLCLLYAARFLDIPD